MLDHHLGAETEESLKARLSRTLDIELVGAGGSEGAQRSAGLFLFLLSKEISVF